VEFGEAVARRHMVRSYLPEPVDPESLDRILDAARRAPSAGFSQGVELIVVTAAADRARLATAAGEDDHVARGRRPWLSVAPVHVIVAVEPGAYRRRYRESDKAATHVDDWPAPYWWIDSGAVLMLLLLAATAEGLAAGFLGIHAFEGLEEIVALPPTHRAIGLVTIGRAADDSPVGSARRPRRPRHETEHFGTWGAAPRTDPAT
jgi:nitroreductase